MKKKKIDIDWFRKEIEPRLDGYEIEHRYFKDGDMGDLSQVLIESAEKGGEIYFWSSGWLEVVVYDYIKQQDDLNIMLEPHQISEKEDSLNQLIKLLAKK